MITIISGTNRKDSKSISIAEIYKEILKNLEVESEIMDLRELPESFLFSALYENVGKNDDFNPFIEKIRKSEKFVFIVPEYNASFPGVLKAFIDGLSYPSPFMNKKGAVVGISSGTMAGALALSHLTDILNYLGMHVLASKPRLPRIESLLTDGKLNDTFHSRLLEAQAKSLVSF